MATVLPAVSETMQMYIKAIHDIQLKKGAARVTDIAELVGVKKGSVSVALKNLALKGLVNYAPYDVTTLTDSGLSIAEDLDRRYGALNDFFVSVLGIDPKQAHNEACDLEHHISSEVFERSAARP